MLTALTNSYKTVYAFEEPEEEGFYCKECQEDLVLIRENDSLFFRHKSENKKCLTHRNDSKFKDKSLMSLIQMASKTPDLLVNIEDRFIFNKGDFFDTSYREALPYFLSDYTDLKDTYFFKQFSKGLITVDLTVKHPHTNFYYAFEIVDSRIDALEFYYKSLFMNLFGIFTMYIMANSREPVVTNSAVKEFSRYQYGNVFYTEEGMIKYRKAFNPQGISVIRDFNELRFDFIRANPKYQIALDQFVITPFERKDIFKWVEKENNKA